MLCYHGTNADNLPSILKNGLSTSQKKIWDVSNNDVYCWGPNYLKEEGIEEYASDCLMRQAFDSSLMSLGRAKDCRAVVVEFDIDESELDDDNSCPNMGHANCVHRDILPHEITNIYISDDLSLLKGYFLSLLIDRELIAEPLNDLESRVASVFAKQEFYLEELYDEFPLQVLER